VTWLRGQRDRDQQLAVLGRFDCVVLANVPADAVSEDDMEALRLNTQDQGCGLIMVGGPESFGAGGWQNTPVEKALPVDCEIKSLEVQGKGGLVLVMHASEMAEGNFWQKRIAKLAVDRLGPTDEVGVIDYDFKCKWVVPLQPVGPNKDAIKAKIDRMMPGDMPDFDPALAMARDALLDPAKNFVTRHVIVISDGDPVQGDPGLLPSMKAKKITVTTVGVACHGANEDQKMAAIARATGGRSYSVKNPNQLPAIYIKETRLVSQSFVHEQRFPPIVALRTPVTDKLDPPHLGGFVRTTAKASPLVEVSIRTPKLADQDFPVLATWHYGLGKSAAFTSDAGQPRFWSKEWVAGKVYGKFWEQLLDWSMRPTETGKLTMTTEARDGKVRVVVEARDDEGRADTKLRLRGVVTGPGEVRRQELRFVQKAAGRYEAEVRAEEAGSYFINAQSFRVEKKVDLQGRPFEQEAALDSVRAAVTLPTSPEYSEMEPDTALLEQIAELTGGKVYKDDEATLRALAKAGVPFRPMPEPERGRIDLWYWLLWLCAGGLFVDVALRRVALSPGEIKAAAWRLWLRLRGQAVPEAGRDAYMERLRQGKAAAGTALARRRFEATAATQGAPPTADDTRPLSGPEPTPPTAAGGPAPLADETEADALERLRRAKRDVWKERGPDKDKPR
jgi:uncharacterized membrane protein